MLKYSRKQKAIAPYFFIYSFQQAAVGFSRRGLLVFLTAHPDFFHRFLGLKPRHQPFSDIQPFPNRPPRFFTTFSGFRSAINPFRVSNLFCRQPKCAPPPFLSIFPTPQPLPQTRTNSPANRPPAHIHTCTHSHLHTFTSRPAPPHPPFFPHNVQFTAQFV